VLDLRGVLKTTVNNSLEALRLQDEVVESRRVDADVVPLLCLLSGVRNDLGGLLVLETEVQQ